MLKRKRYYSSGRITPARRNKNKSKLYYLDLSQYELYPKYSSSTAGQLYYSAVSKYY